MSSTPSLRARLSWPFAILPLAACGVPRESPGPALQGLVGAYAPGVQLGMPVADLPVGAPYRLTPAAYEGLVDEAYRAPDGFGRLTVGVDQFVGDHYPITIPAGARVGHVTLRATDTATLGRADRRLRAALGPPTRVFCPATGGPGERRRVRYWASPGGGGAVLFESTVDSGTRRWGGLTLGTTPVITAVTTVQPDAPAGACP
jgi:hypothetical protein